MIFKVSKDGLMSLRMLTCLILFCGLGSIAPLDQGQEAPGPAHNGEAFTGAASWELAGGWLYTAQYLVVLGV